MARGRRSAICSSSWSLRPRRPTLGRGAPERESGLGSWMADCYKDATGADVAFQNGGGIRADIAAGPVTLRDLFNVMPFDNTLVKLKMTGAQVRSALDHGVGSPRADPGRRRRRGVSSPRQAAARAPGRGDRRRRAARRREDVRGDDPRFSGGGRRRFRRVRAGRVVGADGDARARRAARLRREAENDRAAAARAAERLWGIDMVLKDVRAKVEQTWTTTKKILAMMSVWGLVFSLVTIARLGVAFAYDDTLVDSSAAYAKAAGPVAEPLSSGYWKTINNAYDLGEPEAPALRRRGSRPRVRFPHLDPRRAAGGGRGAVEEGMAPARAAGFVFVPNPEDIHLHLQDGRYVLFLGSTDRESFSRPRRPASTRSASSAAGNPFWAGKSITPAGWAKSSCPCPSFS